MRASIAAAAILLTAGTASGGDLRARVESAPKAVAAFIQRRADCDHFLGEEPYDKQRAADLARTVRELRCDGLDLDERKLRRTFKNKAQILKLLDETGASIDW